MMDAETAAEDIKYGDITPFTSETIKTEEKLDLSWASFRHPKLARCPFNVRDMAFEACLGRGIDGMVFKAQYESKTIVLKIFFHKKKPYGFNYWPFERECMTATLLEKIAARVRESRETKQPLYMYPAPTTHREAVYNLHAFSDDIDQNKALPKGVEPWQLQDGEELNINPCYGWLSIPVKDLHQLMRWHGRPEYDDFDLVGPSYCIAYNYVSDGGGDTLDIDRIIWHQRFFHRAGFYVAGFKHDNWRGDSTLIDMGDLVSPAHGPGWPAKAYAYDNYADMERWTRASLEADKKRQDFLWTHPNEVPPNPYQRYGFAPGTFQFS